ncbi:GNAT family N-acetyltransferase [Alkalihalobacterium chitinilyticum]|uniref:GNAT family N-acetyltransferase n=1 Tax=Alkalihalobacterium chitinilyticum TaxID=2980103 RepID=A0ABT5VI88_9BACI|nr:GNAT family N-acetyltransferase [Alkalihalobacterium chitinilyticum]MDE5415176.1 GNAT family N-acetyltransferase [Alkalihalobacterium chitinilyticum]
MLGAEYYYITKDNGPVGLIHYLLNHKSDHLPWIGLLIVHKQHGRGGIASKALHLLEKKLIDQNKQKVRLCVQDGNEIGAAFWRQEGFVIINSATDGHNNRVDNYEKKL